MDLTPATVKRLCPDAISAIALVDALGLEADCPDSVLASLEGCELGHPLTGREVSALIRYLDSKGIRFCHFEPSELSEGLLLSMYLEPRLRVRDRGDTILVEWGK